MRDVLSFGEAIVDFFPEAQGIALVDAETLHRHQGGAPANLAVGLARLGLRSGLMTLVGADAFGVFLRKRLLEEGVDVAGVGVHPTARTGLAFVSVAKDGARDFTFYRHPSSDQLIQPKDVDASIIAGARVFHVGSSTLAKDTCRQATFHALALATDARRVVSSDPNPRLHIWERPDELPALVTRLLSSVHVAKVSLDELALLGLPQDPVHAAAAVRRMGPALVLVTLGADGCVFDGQGCGQGHVAGLPVQVVDTTGAGDGFMAGFLSSVAPVLHGPAAVAALDRSSVLAACSKGNRVGATVVTRFGATAALPTAKELAAQEAP